MPAGAAIRVDRDEAQRKLRLSGFVLANHHLAVSAVLGRSFGLAPDDVIIVLTVALGNVQRMLRQHDDDGIAASTALVDQDRIVPVSRRAVARASGLPRETVRRRTNRLIEQGALLHWGDGLRTARRLVVAPAMQAAIFDMLDSFAATARRLERAGVLVLAPGDPPRGQGRIQGAITP